MSRRTILKIISVLMLIILSFSLVGCMSSAELNSILDTLKDEGIINKSDTLIYHWADDASPIPAMEDYNYYYQGKDYNYLIEINAMGNKDDGYRVYKYKDIEVIKEEHTYTRENSDGKYEKYTDYEYYTESNENTKIYNIEVKVVDFKFFWIKLGEKFKVTKNEQI